MSATYPFAAFGGTISALIENDLIMPGSELRIASVMIQGGQNLVCGSVMGRITATDKYVLSDASATDGSEVPRAILLEDLVPDQDVLFSVAVGGHFNETALAYGPGHTQDTVRHPLRDARIYLSAHRWSFS